jgi:hypothetical protein
VEYAAAYKQKSVNFPSDLGGVAVVAANHLPRVRELFGVADVYGFACNG